jgi:YD repeat-containing protein
MNALELNVKKEGSGYGYDTENKLTSITAADNNTTSFTYDTFGRVTKTTFPSGYTETYNYDAVGNLLRWTCSGGQVTWTTRGRAFAECGRVHVEMVRGEWGGHRR